MTLEPKVLAADDSCDLVIVGSGSGAMCAALVAHQLGKKVIILEKEELVGGSSSRSGGAVWIPANHLMANAGVTDSAELALRYIEGCIKEHTPATTRSRIEAYVKTGPEMLRFLEKAGVPFRHAAGYSDYYDTLPGGQPQGRAVEAELFDSRKLGPWAARMNRYAMFAMPALVSEFSALSNATRTTAGKIAGLRLMWRFLLQKIRGADIFGQGAAMQARLLRAVLDRGIPVHLGARVTGLLSNNERINGVTVASHGRAFNIRGRHGVLLNAGGFSRNAAMREQYLPKPQATSEFSLVNPGDTGEVMEAAIAAGAATDQMNEAWWLVGSKLPNGMHVSHTIDLSKPHSMMVDAEGRRYVNEAMAYMELGQTMFAHHQKTPSVPSWAIFDSRHRNRYTWALSAPGEPPAEWLQSGYMKRANSLVELAQQCGIDPRALTGTADKFNWFARSGVDTDFGRGARAYERMNGDPTCKPNPNLGTIEMAPFYAVQIHVGDVGTCGGLLTDEDGRVLRASGEPITGLYACGNIAANCFGRSYPGPGITLGQSMIFGYRAAMRASEPIETSIR